MHVVLMNVVELRIPRRAMPAGVGDEDLCRCVCRDIEDVLREAAGDTSAQVFLFGAAKLTVATSPISQHRIMGHGSEQGIEKTCVA